MKAVVCEAMIVTDPTVSGPHDPVQPAPRRRPGSVRRTSTIDTFRPAGFDAEANVIGRARDLLTDGDGEARVLGNAVVTARLKARSHDLLAIETDPVAPALEGLLGAIVGPGFRAKVDGVVPDRRDHGDLLYLLLDDLPGATLVAGYAMLHAGMVPKPSDDEYLIARSDLCAGWAADGAMMTLIREHGRSPAPMGCDAPPVARADDPDAWHALPELAPNAMRRLRRLDVMPPTADGAPAAVDVFFRDSHVDGEGRETIVHEYSVAASVDVAARTIATIDARADVLPWRECPQAIASASRLVGRTLAGLRPYVRGEFIGTTTCTHLNDVLRGLTDVDHMLDAVLEEHGGASRSRELAN
jgi:hypothetical protein